MVDPQANSSAPIKSLASGAAALSLLALALAMILNLAWEEGKGADESRAKERVYEQIADIKAGKTTVIRLACCNRDLAAFVKARRELTVAGKYALEVAYVGNVDDFLRQIAGLRGLRSLLLHNTDVSDAGMEFVASLPDLRELRVVRPGVSFTAAGADKLLSRANLESLQLDLVGDVPPDIVERLRKCLPRCEILAKNESR